MIIRNHPKSSTYMFIIADNRSQSMGHGPQAVNGPQLT